MQLTAQEIFDRVCLHLKAQRECAMRNGECAYRGDNGTKCAVGCLISDELYNKYGRPEGVKVSGLSDLLQEEAGIYNHLGLCLDLQLVHDDQSHGDNPKFKAALKRVAARHGLEWKHG